MYDYKVPTKAIVTYTDEDWRYQDVLVREPGPHELLIKIVATGVCHTDIANVGGIYPRILGHEGAGKILQRGPDVNANLEEGDPVLLSFAHCGKCHMCATGHPAHCKEQLPLTIQGQDPNFALAEGEGEDQRLENDGHERKRVVKASYFGHSSFSGIALVKESSVVPVKGLIKDDEELKLFAPLGCGIQTGACAVGNIIKPVASQDSIAVFGLGGVGLSALMAGKALGVQILIAVDVQSNRLSLAEELGATHTINSRGMSPQQLSEAIRSLAPFGDAIGPGGPSAVVDTTGVPTLLQAALMSVQRMGRVVQLANKGPGSNVAVGLPEHMSNGTHLTGTIQGDANPKVSIPMLIRWYREGKLPLEKLEHHFKVDDYEKAREEMHKGVVVKPVLLWPQ